MKRCPPPSPTPTSQVVAQLTTALSYLAIAVTLIANGLLAPPRRRPSGNKTSFASWRHRQ